MIPAIPKVYLLRTPIAITIAGSKSMTSDSPNHLPFCYNDKIIMIIHIKIATTKKKAKKGRSWSKYRLNLVGVH